MKNKISNTFRLPIAQHQTIESMAKAQGMSKTSILEGLIDAGLKTTKAPHTQS